MCIMAMSGALSGNAAIKIQETTEADVRLFHIENASYHAVFVPERAMFPLYYNFKPTGKDILVRKAEVATSLRSRDGIQLCLPCVGGIKDRLATKGYLDTAVWDTQLTSDGKSAVLTARTTIDYADPLTDVPARLSMDITCTGAAAHARLSTLYQIKNIGEHPARLMFFAHARLAPEGEYKSGDYIHTPSTRCWISDFNLPVLSDAGVQPHSWIDWPVPGMDTFEPKDPAEQLRHQAYAFIPANWTVIGNDHTGNFIAFHTSEIKLGATTLPEPYFCILRRDTDYLLEIGVSRELDARYWDLPGATVLLAPGEVLSYTMHFAGGRGLKRADAQGISEVTPERITFADTDLAPIVIVP